MSKVSIKEIEAALAASNYNISAAAESLGVTTSCLYQRLNRRRKKATQQQVEPGPRFDGRLVR